MAVCTTFVIMTGGVDLSVGPVLAIAGLVSYFCLCRPAAAVHRPGRTVCRCACRASPTARSSRCLQLPPIIVTLATLSIVRGTALIVGGPEQHLIRDEPAYTFIGAGNLFGCHSRSTSSHSWRWP